LNGVSAHKKCQKGDNSQKNEHNEFEEIFFNAKGKHSLVAGL